MGKGRGYDRQGTLRSKEGKKSIKLDLITVSKDWDGWLVVSERKDKKEILDLKRFIMIF